MQTEAKTANAGKHVLAETLSFFTDSAITRQLGETLMLYRYRVVAVEPLWTGEVTSITNMSRDRAFSSVTAQEKLSRARALNRQFVVSW